MKIIILGAGQVGCSLATNLEKDHDVSIVDISSKKLRPIQNHLDVKTICGSASHPNILEKSGAIDADMVIAVTDNDEVNIVACQISYSLFNIPTKIARIRNKNYTNYPETFNNDNIPIDMIINPSELVTQRLVKLIDHPASFQIVDFSEGKLQLVGSTIKENSTLDGISISQFRKALPENTDSRIVALYRKRVNIIINTDTTLQKNDDVYFIAKHKDVVNILKEFQPQQDKCRKIIIAGGGNIGMGLAKALENNYIIKIIEHNYEACHLAAKKLNNVTVLSGDASDGELLTSENIEKTDLFCAVTNDDEANIMSAMLAKKMGAKHTMALVNSLSYAKLVDDTNNIDRAISPQRITIGIIKTYLRKGDMVNIYSLYSGNAEAMEIIVHGDYKNSNIIGKKISELNFPKSIIVGAITRNNEAQIAHDHFVIQPKDRIIIIITDMSDIFILEKLFKVSPLFS